MATDLLAELKQSKPFRSLEQEAHLNVVRTATVLADAFDLLVKPFGVSAAQYNVLRILQGADPEGLCRNDLRNRLLRRMPDVTRLLDRMERAGLVTRARDSDDRRLVSTRITQKGQRLLDKLDALVEKEHQQRLGHLSDVQLRTLIELLTLVRQRA
ncbi:MAG TPA: MarR family transcriptional regulator [Gemmatimonadaceae bacterium]|nr:MarR family transcriptional regulator [Gemmatimonadaceae bacterium]